MHITGNEGAEFPLDLAAKWTANYRKSNPGGTIAHLFGFRVILRILAQEDCLGLRIYYALDDEGKQQLIVAGVDKNGNDLYKGILAERSVPCPHRCGEANPLNENVK